MAIVLVAVRNPLNMGAAARAMRNFGFAHLRVVRPYEAAFRDARSAVGAEELLRDAQQFGTVAEAVADCTLVVGTGAIGPRRIEHPLRALPEGAVAIRAEIAGAETARAAILFGSEKFGLSNEDRSHCDWLMHIPTEKEQPSMNLGQAVAVCLYELIRGQPAAATDPAPLPAAAGDRERLTGVLLDALQASGYMEVGAAADKELAVRRLVHRLRLSGEDATVWTGMLRQILWKLRAGRRQEDEFRNR